MPNRNPTLAVLIDAENVSARQVKAIHDTIETHGNPVLWRTYGSFTRLGMAAWNKYITETPTMNKHDSGATDLINTNDLGGICVGSIPAPAGEPQCYLPWQSPNRVYPRACGGTDGNVQVGDRTLGLSPRLRGNPLYVRPWVARAGSIPAPAGEPDPAIRSRCKWRVYPRACGGT